jgi:hypothetical protein
MLVGAGGGSLLGLLTDPDRADGQGVAPAEQVAPSTTRHPRSRFAGASSTTTPRRPRTLPTVTAALTPATTARPATTTTPLATTTTRASTTTTTAPSTSTSTTAGDGTTTSSGGASTTT